MLFLEDVVKKYVEFMGGVDEVVKKVCVFYEVGEYCWVVEVVKYVVFVDGENGEVRVFFVDVLE